MRLDPIAPGTRPELAEQEQRILAERGRISPLYQVLLNSPPIAHGWEQMLSAVRNRNSVPADVRELVILRVAVLNRAPYEFDAHVPHALAAGASDAQVAAMRTVPLAADAPLNAAQRVAIRLADAMTRDIEVDDALYAEVQAQFTTSQQQLDLVATVAAYNMVSRLLTALRIGH
ncbi:carboxymuconolactone decarboxylase family protein [Ramlibacter sp. G-1-2-2]|uniref:Carboxymuconolactone decarboxylase family protein n=1 Tax=Ramlibacter agri TaxID=2728837 RepID=A0A848HDA0_9BURK|nr:carboxymuconolactone decarboxylase family protein [Ramlibacter agri]NML47449.1 carboxymuconolactone decarboxylase family protein [Ramlibacter agri]